ncbi:MAG: glutamate-cysteine ligase family protein [Nitriliruptoraceae bacterium]
MPTWDRNRALDHASLYALVEAETTGTGTDRGIGLEVELFPIRERSLQRVPLHSAAGILDQLSASAELHSWLDPEQSISEDGWSGGGADGFQISFEPGGQLEVSGRYQRQMATALDSMESATRRLATILAATGTALAAVGIDQWAPGTVRQQRSTLRYPAMDRYFAARGPAGRVMMRDTCALQLNLDLSSGNEARDRWRVTNLLAPITTATFATSPARGGTIRSQRSLTWQQLDPTRTGFPQHVTDPEVGMPHQLERYAMDADVLLTDDGTGNIQPGRPGWRFSDWMSRGHRRLGWPTAADFRLHLTTLFPEVRPRGFLEIRSIDALPARWRRVPAVLYAGATYEPQARDRILELLLNRPQPLEDQLHTAAVGGVSEPAQCALAVEVWSFALQGAANLPAGTFNPGDLELAERFLDRYTLRGLTPADELATLLRTSGPMAALRWAAEPVTTSMVTSSTTSTAANPADSTKGIPR